MSASAAWSRVQQAKAWVHSNRQLASIVAGVVVLFFTAMFISARQGQQHMRHISELVHKYDAQSCDRLINERAMELQESIHMRDEQIATLTAKSVHLEQENKRLTQQDTEMSKATAASNNAAREQKRQRQKVEAQLQEALQLQSTLIDKMKSNEEAYDQAKKLEEMFKTVKLEYDETTKMVQEFQESTTGEHR